MKKKESIETDKLLAYLSDIKPSSFPKLQRLIHDNHEVIKRLPGEYLYRSSEKARYLFFIISGEGRVFFNLEPDEITTQLFASGDMLHPEDRLNSPCYTQAITEVTAIRLSATEVENWCENDLEISKVFRGALAVALELATVSALLPSIFPEKRRFNFFIRYQGNRFINFPSQHLASYLGMDVNHAAALKNNYKVALC